MAIYNLYPLVQIGPARIESADESNFPGPCAGLDLLLARDRFIRITQNFVIHQFGQIVSLSETLRYFASVLTGSFLQVSRYTGIQSCVVPAGHDVNIELAHLNRGLPRLARLGSQ